MQAYAQHLFTHGYVILPTAYEGNLRQDLEQEFYNAPEFKKKLRFGELNKVNRFGCGATSFCGSPTVFHNKASRSARLQALLTFTPLFQHLNDMLGGGYMLGKNIDRVQIRPAGETPAKESFHRDIPPVKRAGEVWIGGWINCDEENQKFCGVKRTHTLDATELSTAGFAKIRKEDCAQYDAMMGAQANQHDTDKDGKIIIPPGHMILFFANLVHAVNAQKMKYTSVKQFIGFRLTKYFDSGILRPGSKDKFFTFEELDDGLQSNAVLVLSSGQTPPVYPANYLVCRDKQLHLFESWERDMLVGGAMKIPLRDETGKIQHSSHNDFTRSMKSLKELGLPLHPPYTQEEFELLRPQTLKGEPSLKRARLA
jgi:hypothetical protein